MNLHDILSNYIAAYNVPDGATVVCALSGGADSVCLLTLMAQNPNIRTVACHVHHGIRGDEADRDAAFCKALCEKYKVKLSTVYKDVPAYSKETGKSIEDSARVCRYEALAECCENENAYGVMTAHHESDNAETLILNLLRGSGVRGLGGIPPKRPLSRFWLMRPLLEVPKTEILEYLRLSGIEYVVDSTNLELDAMRNYLRGVIFPQFEKINSFATSHIASAALRVRQELTITQGIADDLMDSVSEKDGVVSVYTKSLIDTYDSVRADVLNRMYRLVSKGDEMLTSAHITALNELMRSKSPSAQISLPDTVTAYRQYDKLCMAHLTTYPPYNVSLAVGESVKVANFVVSCKKSHRIYNNFTTFTIDCTKIDDVLSVRCRKEGDSISLLGRNGTKSIKKAMIDSKIPRYERDRLPVIVCKDKVLAVYGLGISKDVAATDLENAITIEVTRQ